MQMAVAAAIAIIARSNLPISVSLVWLTNPVTMPPIFFAQYQVGVLLLGASERSMPMELSVNWLMAELHHIWQPLLLGSLVVGSVVAALGYVLTLLYWRMWVSRNWQRRKLRRRRQSQD
jgi:hypothetical protein